MLLKHDVFQQLSVNEKAKNLLKSVTSVKPLTPTKEQNGQLEDKNLTQHKSNIGSNSHATLREPSISHLCTTERQNYPNSSAGEVLVIFLSVIY